MTENEYIAELKSRWPRELGEEVSLHTIQLADEAIRNFPLSAPLLVIRGNLIELGPETCPHPLEEALSSYLRATKVNPHFAEAWEEIGHYYDAILDDETTAQKYFQQAEKIRRSEANC